MHMPLDRKIAEYLLAVAKANEAGEIPLERTCDGCQECGQQIVDLMPGERGMHVIAVLGGAPLVREEFMVIGCEGYWYVDPELVGLPRGNWQDWQKNG